MVCGSSVIKEEAYCYTDGSKCEEWYKEGRYSRPIGSDSESGNPVNPMDDASDKSDTMTDETEDASAEPEVERQCGIQNISTEQQPTPPWALRIIGTLNNTIQTKLLYFE